ncbi:hypothetical protein AMECASPLE_012763 [Ameca splendens]|uniref:Uncharacterized protein n=1 Tax=Ameca splendens TaxID=208324 RepID=A0ABV0XQ21_9TELE
MLHSMVEDANKVGMEKPSGPRQIIKKKLGRGGAGANLQQSMGKRQGPPWTSCQSISGQHTNNHAHTHSYT